MGSSGIFRTYLLPAAIVSGTVIGAGMFSLPYVFYHSGWSLGVFYFLLFSAAFSLIHLMYADIILRTDRRPKFIGFAKEFLGDWALWPAGLMTTVGMVLILTVYLVLSLSFGALLFPKGLGIYALLGLWLLGSLGMFLDIKKLALSEFFITGSMLVIIVITFFAGAKNFFSAPNFLNPLASNALGTPVSWSGFLSTSPLAALLLPIGPVLFSLSGRPAVPSAIEYALKNELPLRALRKIIILGTLVPATAYLLFIVGALGLSGVVSEDAVSGMALAPAPLLSLLGLLGLIAVFSTYVVIGKSVKDILEADLGYPPLPSGVFIVAAPILLYLAGLSDFLGLVSLVGGVFLAFESIFIVFIWRRLDGLGSPRILLPRLARKFSYPLASVFIIGFIYGVIKFLY